MALELPIKQQDGAVKRISHSERTCSKVFSNVRLINSCLFEGGDYQKNDQLHTGMVPPNAGSIGVDFDSTGTYIYIYIFIGGTIQIRSPCFSSETFWLVLGWPIAHGKEDRQHDSMFR